MSLGSLVLMPVGSLVPVKPFQLTGSIHQLCPLLGSAVWRLMSMMFLQALLLV